MVIAQHGLHEAISAAEEGGTRPAARTSCPVDRIVLVVFFPGWYYGL